MDLDNLANVGELVAAIAAVITLIFVTFELRANRRQNRLSLLTEEEAARFWYLVV